jgi:hypothetical protein
MKPLKCPYEMVHFAITMMKSFQRCHWHSNIIDFPGEYEAICETALGRESGPYGGLFDEKNRGSKISCYCPFKQFLL